MPYRLYAHWLDAEYRRSRSPVASAEATQRLLKIHALLGTQIILSDVQVLDSPGVIDCFEALDFVRFIERHPDMLGFAAGSDSETDPTFSILTAGLRRTQRADWLATTLPTREVKRFAEIVLSRDATILQHPNSSAALSTLLIECPGLVAVHRAMKHLYLHSETVTRSAPPAATFTPLLQQAADQLSHLEDSPTHARHHRLIDETLKFINERTGPAATRSQILTHLERDHSGDLSAATITPIWHTVVHAWNSNVQRSVAGNGGGSIGDLPEGAPIGYYVDEPRDALFPASSPPAWSRALAVAGLDIDPGVLSWSALEELRAATDKPRQSYQDALARGDSLQVHDALNEHLSKLRESLKTQRPPEKSPAGFLGLCYITSGVLAYFGYGVGTSLVAGGLPHAQNVLLEMLNSGERSLMVSALRRAAQPKHDHQHHKQPVDTDGTHP